MNQYQKITPHTGAVSKKRKKRATDKVFEVCARQSRMIERSKEKYNNEKQKLQKQKYTKNYKGSST